MTSMQQQGQRFAAGLTPLPTAARVTRARSTLRWRVISTVVSLVLLVVFWFFFGRDWSLGWTIGIAALWLVSTVFWLVLSAVGLSNAKKDLAAITDGVAFYLDPKGVEFVHPTAVTVPWAEVTALKLAGHNFGAGPNLVVEANGQLAAKVPVAFLDAAPAVIDSAAQAYSLGRVRLDTTALDNLL
ncbi:hypothetical protein C3E87_13035 [Tessaracoccus sp. ZS01]|nr:hypothetical protein [Tessaracoccus sp. ZS01]OMG52302.1 hypothetical protein BJN44_13085 [Tessaracoccus sp. ZS01]